MLIGQLFEHFPSPGLTGSEVGISAAKEPDRKMVSLPFEYDEEESNQLSEIHASYGFDCVGGEKLSDILLLTAPDFA